MPPNTPAGSDLEDEDSRSKSPLTEPVHTGSNIGADNSKSMPSSSSSHTTAGSKFEADNSKLMPSSSSIDLFHSVADKLVKEHAETDLDLALQKPMEQHAIMEERLQNAFNVNEEIKVKQEYEKLWRELKSKVSSTTSLDKLHENMKSIPMRLGTYEETINTCEKELIEDGLKNKDEVDLLQKAAERSEKVFLKERVAELEESEVMVSLADVKRKLDEANKKYDHMLENKNSEISKHLEETSKRNDQAISDMRRKCEEEKQEVVRLEKEEAFKGIKDITERTEQKIKELKEENLQHLLRVQEKYDTLISNMQEEHAKKETSTQLQVETEIRERLNTLWSEHKAQLIKSVRREYEHEIKRLQIELDIEKAKRLRSNDLLSTSPRHPSSPGSDSKRSSTMKFILFALLISLLFGAAMAVFNGNEKCIICSATAGYLRGVSVSNYLILGNALFIPIWILLDILWQVTPIQVPNFIEYIVQLAFGLVSFYLSSACEECKDALSFLVVTCVSFSVIIFLKSFLVLEGFGVVNTLFALGLAIISKFGPHDVWFYLIFFYSPCFLGLKLLVDKYPAAIERARAFFNAYKRHERIA